MIRNQNQIEQQQPKIGLALGAGGARGLAHIGILQVLEEHNIPVHCIAGSSIGALVGSFYAVGHSPQQMRKFLSLFPQKYWLDYTVPKMGFIAGDKVKEIVRMLTKNKRIEELDKPLAIVATHLHKGERTVFRQGSIAEAVRASVSIPGIFEPAVIDGELYVDGGVVDRVPVSVLKEMKADLIVAVDVSYVGETNHQIKSIFDVIAQTIDIMEREILKYRMFDVDVLIRPQVNAYSTTMFYRGEEIIQEGVRSAEQAMPRIQESIRKWRESNTHV
ncbi:NTE family protein [Caldalkalibacillus uzonensis]|uniref:NTE family protein n=1 Tax=Caldalkalibacillus uzonensis TaxID=353224 RepID=A0ABU0CVW7_9BACI|nr:patatin-like phospholipase family protein [Caldalkalibacillus uzonensis]MDQ0339197.1 NTE family protein [Caldalkalibacillus uzonensis]